jgi:hypothetical protein
MPDNSTAQRTNYKVSTSERNTHTHKVQNKEIYNIWVMMVIVKITNNEVIIYELMMMTTIIIRGSKIHAFKRIK